MMISRKGYLFIYLFETGSHYVSQAGLIFTMYLRSSCLSFQNAGIIDMHYSVQQKKGYFRWKGQSQDKTLSGKI
jgi:hypothetical protein